MFKTFSWSRTGLIALALPAMFACSRGQVRQIPLEDFFRNPEKSAFELSPDGRYFSYMSPYEKRSNIFIQPVDGDSAVRITSETERDIAGYAWGNDHRILYQKDTGGDENYQLYGVNIDGSDLRAYTAIPGVKTSFVDLLEQNDSMIIIAMNQRNPQVFDPYRLNINTGELTLLAENPGNILGWQTDNDGLIRVAYAVVDGVNTQILYRDTEQEAFRPVITTNFKDELSFAAFTPDNRQVYALTNLGGRDKTELVKMDPATCAETETLYTNDRYDIGGVWYSHARKKLLAASYIGHKERVRHFFDPQAEAMFGRLKAHFKDAVDLGIVSSDRPETKYIVYAGGDRTYGAYYYYDAEKDELRHIADFAPYLKPDELAEMIPVRYAARDGLEIEGYLTLPVGTTMESARKLPLVVNPHGGPWVRDYWGINPEVQFLANRGYAVLQMNFRGSAGFGRRFTELSYGKWGQTMQDDITDGVNFLVEKGIADPERIAIYGGSYGGYAALMGITKDPDLYAAAVDYVGVSNLFTFLNTIPPYWKPLLDQMYEQVGHPERDSVMLRANSPALNAERIRTPLLVVQGANDPRVNKAESDQMVAALRGNGVDVDYMVKYNEGHGFRNEENRFDFYRAMEKFLGKHLLGIEPEGPIVPDNESATDAPAPGTAMD